MHTKEHFALDQSRLSALAVPPAHRDSSTRGGEAKHLGNDFDRRPARRWLVDGYRLTWAIAIAAALGSGIAVHQVLHEDEDGPSPAATFAAVQPTPDAAAAQTAEDRQALFLVRSTLMALDDANRSGNYTVLRDLAGPRFQARNSALRLRQAFEAFRDAGVDLSHASLVEPRIATRDLHAETGVLAVAGNVPSPQTDDEVPRHRQQIRYSMEFEPVQGHWRLLTLSVGIEPAGREVAGK